MLRQLIKLLVRSGNKKGMDTLLKTHGSKITADDVKYAQNLPHKSKGMPGVRTLPHPSTLKGQYTKPGLYGKGYLPKDMDEITGMNTGRFANWHRKTQPDLIPDKAVYPQWFKHMKGVHPNQVNPLKARIRERILRMRKDPGMAKGLQRLESRKASALNTPGTPWRNKALRYEPTVGRAANFNSLFAKDKGFRDFLRDTVGNKELKSLSPKARDGLAKRYLTLKRKNINAAEAYSKEMDIMEGPNEQYSRMIRGLADEL